MRNILFILNLAAVIASILWLIIQPGYEPLISTIITLVGLISFKIPFSKKGPQHFTMKQRSGKRSKQYQSGGNMTITNHE